MNDNKEINNGANAPEESTNVFKKCINTVKGLSNKGVTWFKEKTKDVKWKEVWDKVTTGILILLMCSPILILGYIFLWFVLKA